MSRWCRDRGSGEARDARAGDAEVLGQFLQQYYRGERIVPAEVVVELREIGDAFISVLVGMHHQRIEYPSDRPEEPAESAEPAEPVADTAVQRDCVARKCLVCSGLSRGVIEQQVPGRGLAAAPDG